MLSLLLLPFFFNSFPICWLRRSQAHCHGPCAPSWPSRAGKERIVPGPPRLIGQPLVVLIGHKRDRPHGCLRHRKEEAVALRRDFEKPDRDNEAVLSGREEPA